LFIGINLSNSQTNGLLDLDIQNLVWRQTKTT